MLLLVLSFLLRCGVAGVADVVNIAGVLADCLDGDDSGIRQVRQARQGNAVVPGGSGVVGVDVVVVR